MDRHLVNMADSQHMFPFALVTCSGECQSLDFLSTRTCMQCEQRRKNAIRREAVGSDEGEAEAGVVIAVDADVAAAVQDRVLRVL